MADANVPIKFEIYKGDQLIREEVLAQSPIKIGKLASSDLRLDDETASDRQLIQPDIGEAVHLRLDARDETAAQT